MSLKFGYIRPLVSMVTDSVMMGKRCLPLFHPFLSILAGNNDMHESWEEFGILLDPTIGVSCPRVSEKILIDL